MDYSELVKDLRYCADSNTLCSECKWFNANCEQKLIAEAADAIEMLLMVWKSAEADHDKMRNAYIAEYDARIEETKRHCPHYIRNVHDRGDDSLCTNFSCEVSALPRWVPVTERLPKDRQRVLVFYWLDVKPKQPWHQVCYFASNLSKVDKYDFDGCNRPGFYNCDSEYGYYELDDVTHWMPLPTPPKEENDGI